MLVLFSNSCKRDLLVRKSEDGSGHIRPYLKLEKVNFNQFLTDLSSISQPGFVAFGKAKKSNSGIMFSNAGTNALVLETDTIKKIKNLDHTTYTIPVKLASSRAEYQWQTYATNLQTRRFLAHLTS